MITYSLCQTSYGLGMDLVECSPHMIHPSEECNAAKDI